MATWIIKRPISGFSTVEVEADKVTFGETAITLFNERDGNVCVVSQMPGLVVVRKDALKS